MTRSTRTYAEMEVPADLYTIVREKLIAAGYEHAIDDQTGALDMAGIALVSSETGAIDAPVSSKGENS